MCSPGAIGSGIVVSLAAIFPDAGIDVGDSIYGRDPRRSLPLDQARAPEKKEFTPVPPGSYGSAAIVLLTDGEELGLQGAKQFFAGDPLLPRIGAIINMEARGGGSIRAGRASARATRMGRGLR